MFAASARATLYRAVRQVRRCVSQRRGRWPLHEDCAISRFKRRPANEKEGDEAEPDREMSQAWAELDRLRRIDAGQAERATDQPLN